MEYNKICIAQNKPSRGNIEENIVNHNVLISKAVEAGAQLIIFPELSLTSYEGSRASELAITLDDKRLDQFQNTSNKHLITIIVSAPIHSDDGVAIGLIIFAPDKRRTSYTKQYLHEDELGFFVTGKADDNIIGTNPKIALAICYEINVSQHSQKAGYDNADVYLSSVAKSAEGVISGHAQLSKIAKEQSMVTMMSNNIGLCEEYECFGGSAIWNKEGDLLDKLDADKEGILVYDFTKDEITYKWHNVKVTTNIS